MGGQQRDEAAHGPVRDGQAGRRATQSQHHALREHLPNDSASPSAERAADGNLALAPRAPRHDDIGNVGAGDEEHREHGTEQHGEHRPSTAGVVLLQRQDVGVAPPIVRHAHRKRRTRPADKGCDRDAIVEQATSHGMQARIPPRKNRKEQGDDDKHQYRQRRLVKNAFLHLKQWRGSAVATATIIAAVTVSLTAGSSNIPSLLLYYALTERAIVTSLEYATERGADAEQRKKIRRYVHGVHARGRAGRFAGATFAQKADVALEAVSGDAVERARVLAKLNEDRFRRRVRGPDANKLLGIAIGKRLEEHGVHDAEDRGVGADT